MNTWFRLNRKIQHIRSWTGSIKDVAEFPTAIALSQYRSRAPIGSSFYARCMRRFGHRQLCVHPRMLDGLSIALRPTNTSELIIYEELFFEKVYDFSPIRFEPDVVLDCGGFQGYFTLLANVRFPSAKFLAFEPSPLNYRAMLSNFERNGLHIDARQQAVSIHAGTVMFSEDGAGGHLTTTVDPNSVEVQVVDLREIVSDLASRRLLLKLDVEGEEGSILPGLLPLLPSTCAIFFEWHHSDSALKQIEASLQNAGFTTERNRTREGPDGIVYVDTLAIRN